MGTLIVQTKEELERAKNLGISEIIIIGEFAEEVHSSKKIAQLSKVTLAMLIAAVALTPFTRGGSAIGLTPISVISGLDIASIIIATSIGITLISAIWKGYDEISYDKGKLILKKKDRPRK